MPEMYNGIEKPQNEVVGLEGFGVRIKNMLMNGEGDAIVTDLEALDKVL